MTTTLTRAHKCGWRASGRRPGLGAFGPDGFGRIWARRVWAHLGPTGLGGPGLEKRAGRRATRRPAWDVGLRLCGKAEGTGFSPRRAVAVSRMPPAALTWTSSPTTSFMMRTFRTVAPAGRLVWSAIAANCSLLTGMGLLSAGCEAGLDCTINRWFGKGAGAEKAWAEGRVARARMCGAVSKTDMTVLSLQVDAARRHLSQVRLPYPDGTVVSLQPKPPRRVPTHVTEHQPRSPLCDRPEWLGPRDIQEVFGVGRTKSYQLVNDLPHIRVGGLLRVNRRTVQKELLDKGRLP